MKKALISISVALLATSGALADDQPTMEAFLGLDHTDWNGVRGLIDENGADLGLAFNANNDWAIEGWYARSETEPKNFSDDVVVETASINLLRHLNEGKTRGFVTMGVSHLMLNPEFLPSDTESTLDVGLGLKHYFDNNLILRADLIGRIFDNDNFVVDQTFRLSLGYGFGRTATKTVKRKPQTIQKISKPTVIAPPKDSDGDGVIDSKDQCPNTNAKLKVDEKGCALTLSETVKIDINIQFPNNSDVIDRAYLNEIKAVAEFMDQYAGTVVEVRGYTDDRGSAEYNQQLSEKRAKSVAAKLTSDFGISANRVNAVGYGEKNPIADNASAEGRSKNRRVVAEISTRVEKTLEK